MPLRGPSKSGELSLPGEMQRPHGETAANTMRAINQDWFSGGRSTRARWRRGRDSNPRYAFDVYSLSRGAPSTTRPPLRSGLIIGLIGRMQGLFVAAHIFRGRFHASLYIKLPPELVVACLATGPQILGRFCESDRIVTPETDFGSQFYRDRLPNRLGLHKIAARQMPGIPCKQAERARVTCTVSGYESFSRLRRRVAISR